MPSRLGAGLGKHTESGKGHGGSSGLGDGLEEIHRRYQGSRAGQGEGRRKGTQMFPLGEGAEWGGQRDQGGSGCARRRPCSPSPSCRAAGRSAAAERAAGTPRRSPGAEAPTDSSTVRAAAAGGAEGAAIAAPRARRFRPPAEGLAVTMATGGAVGSLPWRRGVSRALSLFLLSFEFLFNYCYLFPVQKGKHPRERCEVSLGARPGLGYSRVFPCGAAPGWEAHLDPCSHYCPSRGVWMLGIRESIRLEKISGIIESNV